MSRKFTVFALFCLLVIIGLLEANQVVAGDAHYVQLKSAPPLSGTITQSLAATPNNGSTQLKVDKDYKILDSHYLDNNDWVVVKVSTIKTGDNATLVMHRVSGNYQVVLGPGTAFSVDNSQGVPADVVQYLMSQGVVIYEPSTGQ